MMGLADALGELAELLRSPEFADDPAGVLREFATVVTGDVDLDGRWYPQEGPGESARPPLDPVESLALALAAHRGAVANADLRKRLPGLSAETIRLRLQAMVAQGLLERTGRNSGTRYAIRQGGQR